VSISNISPAVAGSVVSVFSRASPMCDFLQKVTEQIRSGGSEPEQYAELTALMARVGFRVFVTRVVRVPFMFLTRCT
jgi:dissimilatory sulfite reductase (desulfoviridin) alpha/beta subunit